MLDISGDISGMAQLSSTARAAKTWENDIEMYYVHILLVKSCAPIQM